MRKENLHALTKVVRTDSGRHAIAWIASPTAVNVFHDILLCTCSCPSTLFMELSNFKRDTGRMRCPLEVMGWELIFIVDLYGKADERGTSKRMSERARDQERNKEREKEKE